MNKLIDCLLLTIPLNNMINGEAVGGAVSMINLCHPFCLKISNSRVGTWGSHVEKEHIDFL